MSDDEQKIRQMIEGAARVKLPGGIVGKASSVLIAFCAALASIVVAIRSPGIGYAAIAALAVVVLTVIWLLIRFAERHPATAILEGAEYVAYQQIRLAQKDVGDIPPSPDESPVSEPLPLLPADAEAAKSPDPPPTESGRPKRLPKNG